MLTIDWTQAPEWANFAVMDAEGRWSWHEENPEEEVEYKVFPRWERIEIDHSKTLQARPTPTSPATLNNMDNY